MKQTSVAGSGLVLGLLVGAAIALLYAPKKGSETRSDVVRASKKSYDSATKYFNRVERKAGKVRKDIITNIEGLVERVNEGDDEARVELEKFLNNLDDVAKKL